MNTLPPVAAAVRVRFAPSPTGTLHIGGARTAIFNFLFARHCGGHFILRIEDTDQKRFQAEALREIYESLRWLGIGWDEGPDVGGPQGPYVQSQRSDIYRQHAQQLLAAGAAYRCFCTPERLEQLRREQEKSKMASGSGYDRHCRDLAKDQVQRLLAAGTPAVIRLRIPLGRVVVFEDRIRGRIETSSDVLDDLVLLKSDGLPTYHLANVVDDHVMGITHVLRGDEWIASTPRHILIYEAFGWAPPRFAHLPIILSPQGGKLSKRKGAASVLDYRRAGYLPETLFNFLALLGWAPGDDREIMTPQESIAAFQLEAISPKAAVLDEKKLEWMNGHYLHRRSADSLLPDVVALWKQAGFLTESSAVPESYLRTVVSLLKDRSRRINELAENARYFFEDPQTYEAASVRKYFTPEVAATLGVLLEKLERLEPFDRVSLESLYHELSQTSGLASGQLIHPTRLAVSGVSGGPGLFELLETLGKERVLRRLRAALDWCSRSAQMV